MCIFEGTRCTYNMLMFEGTGYKYNMFEGTGRKYCVYTCSLENRKKKSGLLTNALWRW